MELQIQDLVAEIRKEGVDVANEQAGKITDEAQKKATEIVTKAKQDAQTAKDVAAREIDTLKEGAIKSADQAKRDALLGFKDEVYKQVDKILACKVKDAMNGEALATLIKAAIQGEDISKYTVEVANVSDGLKKELAGEIEKGLELMPAKGMVAGFKLAAKDGSGYFDCSDEEIMELLKPYFRNLDI